jgi:hypothetical protein
MWQLRFVCYPCAEEVWIQTYRHLVSYSSFLDNGADVVMLCLCSPGSLA